MTSLTELVLMIKIVLHSVSQHQSTVAAVATRWAEFYREYQSFQKWINNLDMDMSNINPFIGNLSSVRIQLEKMKVTTGDD